MKIFKMIDNSEYSNSDDSNPNYLFELPCEIRVLIYKCCNSTSVLNLRLVNKTLKKEIDEYLEVDIRIDQTYRAFRQLCRRRAKSLKILNLTHRNIQKQGLLGFPHLIKKITFDGTVTKTNLCKIISQCKNNIEELSFTHETLSNEKLIFETKCIKDCLNFLNIRILNLQLLRYPDPLGDPFENDNNRNIEMFFALTFPYLKSFKLYFSLWGNWTNLFQFLQRHVKTLNELEIQVGDRGDVLNTTNYLKVYQHSTLLNKIDRQVLRKIVLKEFKFRDDVLNLNKTVKDLWLEIIKLQKTLEVFQFLSPGEITREDLQHIILSNGNTLKEIAIYNIKSNSSPIENNMPNNNEILDMTNFARCPKLKTLALANNSSPLNVNNNQAGEHNNIPSMQMIHLSSLPSSLESIHLTGFNFITSDIVYLSKNLPNLKEVLIIDSGPMQYSILINLLKNCPKLEYIYIKPIIPPPRCNNNNLMWHKELAEINKLYTKFMNSSYDPHNELEGFEAFLDKDKYEWIEKNLNAY